MSSDPKLPEHHGTSGEGVSTTSRQQQQLQQQQQQQQQQPQIPAEAHYDLLQIEKILHEEVCDAYEVAVKSGSGTVPTSEWWVKTHLRCVIDLLKTCCRWSDEDLEQLLKEHLSQFQKGRELIKEDHSRVAVHPSESTGLVPDINSGEPFPDLPDVTFETSPPCDLPLSGAPVRIAFRAGLLLLPDLPERQRT